MEPHKSDHLMQIPGNKIFQSSFSLKMTIPDPFPGPILKIPPSDPQRFYRPSVNGTDLAFPPPLYVPKNMNIPLEELYKLFEMEMQQKDSEKDEKGRNSKGKWFTNENQKQEKNSSLFEESEWTQDHDLILQHSAKKTFRHELAFSEHFPKFPFEKKEGISQKITKGISQNMVASMEKLGNAQEKVKEGRRRESSRDFWESGDLETEKRSDVLYTDEMNKEFYKQKISKELQQSFLESEGLRKETLTHPRRASLKAKHVYSLLPCTELLGQIVFDVHLGNKLEKTKEHKLLNEEGLVARVGFNDHQEKTLAVFQTQKERNEEIDSHQNGSAKEETLPKEVMEKVGEFGVLRKKLGGEKDRKMLMMIVNDEHSAEIKEVDYSFFLRNVKRMQEEEEIALEEDLEEEARFKKEEQKEVHDLDSFLSKRLAQLYPTTEGVLWDKPHPPPKPFFPKRVSPQEETVREAIEEESEDSLFDD